MLVVLSLTPCIECFFVCATLWSTAEAAREQNAALGLKDYFGLSWDHNPHTISPRFLIVQGRYLFSGVTRTLVPPFFVWPRED